LAGIERRIGDDDVLHVLVQRGLVADVLQAEHDPGVAHVAGRDADRVRTWLLELRGVDDLGHLLFLQRAIGLRARHDRRERRRQAGADQGRADQRSRQGREFHFVLLG
jgi:hypothetical protein